MFFRCLDLILCLVFIVWFCALFLWFKQTEKVLSFLSQIKNKKVSRTLQCHLIIEVLHFSEEAEGCVSSGLY